MSKLNKDSKVIFNGQILDLATDMTVLDVNIELEHTEEDIIRLKIAKAEYMIKIGQLEIYLPKEKEAEDLPKEPLPKGNQETPKTKSK